MQASDGSLGHPGVTGLCKSPYGTDRYPPVQGSSWGYLEARK